MASEGLIYKEIWDSLVVAGRGECTDKVIDIPSEDGNGRRVIGIADLAFEADDGLAGVKIPGNVRHIGYGAFSGCVNLGDVRISARIMEIGDSAFEKCVSLEKIVLPSSVCSVGRSAFAGCSALRSVSMSPGLSEIKSGTFRDCASLSEVTLHDGVTYIGFGAFAGCTGLRSVTIPWKTKTLGDFAFHGCTALENVRYDAVELDGSAFKGTFYDAGAKSGGVTVTVDSRVKKIPANLFDSFTTMNPRGEPLPPEELERRRIYQGAIVADDGRNFGLIKRVVYLGDRDGWEKIDIGSGNDSLLDAEITFRG